MTRRLPASATILGKRWRVRLVSNLTSPAVRAAGEKVHGLTDHPDSRGKVLRVAAGLSPADEMDALIHEFLHAADWHKDHDWVEQAASDLTRLLRAFGYRRQDETT